MKLYNIIFFSAILAIPMYISAEISTTLVNSTYLQYTHNPEGGVSSRIYTTARNDVTPLSDEEQSTDSISIFPVITTGPITVELFLAESENREYRYELTHIDGNVLRFGFITQPLETLFFNDIRSGNYILTFYNPMGIRKSFKIIKQ